MGIFDIIILIILLGFVFYGLFFGLIRAVGSLTGLIVGIWLATLFYLPAFALVQNLFFGHDATGKIIVFLVLFTLINRLVCFLFTILDNTYNFISIIPFLKTINRLAGAAFGFVLGGFVLGLVFYYTTTTPFLSAIVGRFIETSQVVPFLLKFSQPIISIIPEIINKVSGWLSLIKQN